ncbi:hypothetical protein KSP40_PGU008213 [Platanthera guangdongensis]|uniref:NADH:quinone oxidoreductase/Mrp antiporter transmembrane domain-containing protein n=1 Tax=Platanthera guangdongensis TaxID=2320717 RepID=A0ABR2N5M9_9ASPA
MTLTRVWGFCFNHVDRQVRGNWTDFPPKGHHFCSAEPKSSVSCVSSSLTSARSEQTSEEKKATLCIPLSVEYIECTEIAITEFLLFVLTATLGGMFLCGANDLITIFVAPECFSLCSYLLSGYTKRDIRSNEATMKYLLMGGSSSSILVRCLSWKYGLSGEEIELQEIVNGRAFLMHAGPDSRASAAIFRLDSFFSGEITSSSSKSSPIPPLFLFHFLSSSSPWVTRK